MKRALVTLIVLCLPAAVPAATSSQVSKPSCVATTARIASGPYDTTFRVRCNYLTRFIDVRPSRRIARVAKDTTLVRADEGDQMRCSRRARRLLRCRGEAGEAVTVVGRFAVRGDPCSKPKLRTFFYAFGGEDCDPPGSACPSIAYAITVRDRDPSGC